MDAGGAPDLRMYERLVDLAMRLRDYDCAMKVPIQRLFLFSAPLGAAVGGSRVPLAERSRGSRSPSQCPCSGD